MAPKDLLRHIFRHGPHSTSMSNTSPLRTSESLHEEPASNENDTTVAPLPLTHRSNTTQSPTLENIAEESESETDSTSIAHIPISLNIHISTFTTRELIYATIDEARIATRAHLDTIHTTLALLDALEGFSPTIPVVKEEMVLNQRVCEERLKMLEETEAAVEQVKHFGDEGGAGPDNGIGANP